MNVTGIIMECNPFHEGHAYLLREARRRTEADYIVVVMSGDFVQRGEPAVYDKYIRAQQILRAGADLVLEMPLYAACGSAEYFAQGGIRLLDRLGVVTDLCFGSESGCLDHLLQCAQALAEAEQDGPSSALYRQELQRGLRAGLSFPAAREKALMPLLQSGGDSKDMTGVPFPSAPNDLLGVEYCRVFLDLGSTIRPQAISRIDVPSATQRRKKLLAGRDDPSAAELYPRVPDRIPRYPLGPDDFSSQLLYELRMEEENLDRYVDVSPELRDRIRKLLPDYRTFSSFCSLLKTRNVTHTRVSRALLHILLRMEKSRLAGLSEDGFALYARPLGMCRSAAPLLSAIHRHSSIPFLSRLSSAPEILSEKALFSLKEELRAEEFYTFVLRAVRDAGNPQDGGSSRSRVLPSAGPAGEEPSAEEEGAAEHSHLPVPRAVQRKLVVE